jgi:hypothetical protein
MRKWCPEDCCPAVTRCLLPVDPALNVRAAQFHGLARDARLFVIGRGAEVASEHGQRKIAAILAAGIA